MSEFDLNLMAHAMRGMPRDAKIVVKMPDGELKPVVLVSGLPSSPGHTGHLAGAAGYTIVLHVGPEL
jgi:hypothetical protein